MQPPFFRLKDGRKRKSKRCSLVALSISGCRSAILGTAILGTLGWHWGHRSWFLSGSQRHFGDSLHEQASSCRKSRCIASKQSTRSNTTAFSELPLPRVKICIYKKKTLYNYPFLLQDLHPTHPNQAKPKSSYGSPCVSICDVHQSPPFRRPVFWNPWNPWNPSFSAEEVGTKAFSELSNFGITVLLENLRGIGILLSWLVLNPHPIAHLLVI